MNFRLRLRQAFPDQLLMLWFISSVSTGILPQMAWGRGYSQTRAHIKLRFLLAVRGPGQVSRRQQPDHSQPQPYFLPALPAPLNSATMPGAT